MAAKHMLKRLPVVGFAASQAYRGIIGLRWIAHGRHRWEVVDSFP